MTQPQLGYGHPTEATIDQVNTWMRSTPWYQQQMRAWGQDPGHPTLTKAQSQQVLKAAQAQGVVVDEGNMEVDDHGNFNPKGHKLRNTLMVAGIAGATLATMGAAGVFAGAAAPAAAGGIMGISPTALFTGGTQLFGNLFGAWMQGHGANEAAQAEAAAAKYGADLQDAANRRSEAFLRQQSENAYQNNEVARRGNYDMYAAGQRRLGYIGNEVGLGPREIPAYVAGVDPNYTGGGSVGAAAGGAPPDLSAVQAKFDALFPGETLTPDMLAAKRPELEALGFTLNPNAAGKITDLTYQGVNIDPIQGAGSGVNRKQWLVGGGGGAPAAPRAAAPVYSSPAVPFVTGTAAAPALGYFGSYA